MKNLFNKLLMLAVVASLGLTYSCSDDEEDPVAAPSIALSAEVGGAAISSGAEVEAGNVIEVSAVVTAPGGFNVFRGTGTGTSGTEITVEASRNDLGLDAGATEASISLPDLETEGLDGETFDWAFEAVDDANQIGTATFSYDIVAPPSPDAVANVGVILNGQLNASGGSFLDVIENAVYGYADTRDAQSANVDMVFFYGTTNMYTIASLDDTDAGVAFGSAVGADALSASTIATRNPTKFKVLSSTAADFDGVATEADLLTLFGGDVAAADTKVNGLSAGDVFGFELASARGSVIGLVSVTATGGTSGADRTITFNVKYNASTFN